MGCASLGNLNVLVVGENRMLRKCVRIALSALGVTRMTEAADESAGLSGLADCRPDVVICGWDAPPMAGIELVRAVRAAENDALRQVPIVGLVAGGDMASTMLEHSGAVELIGDMVTPNDLLGGVNAALQKAGAGEPEPATPARGAATSAGEGGDPVTEMRERIHGTNINDQTFLATDYLNHFNEVMMMLEMAADFPDVLDRAKQWRPKAYADHFRDSGLSDTDLIVAAYEIAPEKFRIPFDETVAELNRMVETGIQAIEDAVETGDKERTAVAAATVVSSLRETLEKANSIIHGAVETMDQDAIDKLFDD